jgi:hypothetical protein
LFVCVCVCNGRKIPYHGGLLVLVMVSTFWFSNINVEA